jgi:branched-subunit amino acid transport protein
MKKDNHTLNLSIFLLGASFLLYLINFIIFKDFHHIAVFMTEDLAFIPIEVLVTVLIIDRILESRDNKKKKQKINILIEVFFEEVGNDLLCKLSSKDKNCCEIGCLISEIGESFENDLNRLRKAIDNHQDAIELGSEDINSIYELLQTNKDIFIKFLENPHLTEHDIFTDLLQSVSHLYHEIKFRKKNKALSEADIIHLREDAQRVYKYLSQEWLVYMDYIQKEYPFLFNLAIKNVPFNDTIIR